LRRGAAFAWTSTSAEVDRLTVPEPPLARAGSILAGRLLLTHGWRDGQPGE
jgi:O-acetyl-ADP-ribose deacetylase (regulator of RNase III)